MAIFRGAVSDASAKPKPEDQSIEHWRDDALSFMSGSGHFTFWCDVLGIPPEAMYLRLKKLVEKRYNEKAGMH